MKTLHEVYLRALMAAVMMPPGSYERHRLTDQMADFEIKIRRFSKLDPAENGRLMAEGLAN